MREIGRQSLPRYPSLKCEMANGECGMKWQLLLFRIPHSALRASLTHSMESVIEQAFAHARQRDPVAGQPWVVLVDGSGSQIQAIERVAAKYRQTIVIVVDLIHVLEYLWSAGQVFYATASQELETWVSQQLKLLLQGKSSQIARIIRARATRQNLTASQRKAVDECARYLLNHKQYLRYPLYLTRGYPIATGVIEGACRYLVKDRMEKTGARWSLAGAEAVLKLRALVCNGLLEPYWTFYQQREHVRLYKIRGTKSDSNHDYKRKRTA
jgi:hypothetical protein